MLYRISRYIYDLPAQGPHVCVCLSLSVHACMRLCVCVRTRVCTTCLGFKNCSAHKVIMFYIDLTIKF
jgi:hypothetical protein